MRVTDALAKYGRKPPEIRKWFASSRGLFGVFDAATNQQIALLAEENVDRSECLYNGEKAQELKYASPYLFDFNNDYELFESIASLMWDQPIGFLFSGKGTIADYKEHFRRWYLVQLPDGRKAFFRFFDPRVFSAFVSSEDLRSVIEFMEPFNFVICKTRSGWQEFRVESQVVKKRKLEHEESLS